MVKRFFAGWRGSVIPKGAEVEVLAFLPSGKAIVEYQGKRYWVLTRLLRKGPVK